MPGPSAIVFLDFDGTITGRDATDAILEAFADPAWRQIEAEWVAGRIGSRECLAAQLALVTATPAQIDRLLDSIAVDPGFTTLLDVCATMAAPVHVVSDGFDYCIRRILGRSELNLAARFPGLQVVSSGLHEDGAKWRASFAHPSEPCAHGCATCKPAAIERLHTSRALSVFVGDGLSDRYAAACTDVVFAKDKLAAYCDRVAISYAPYDTLADVADGIGQLLETGRLAARSLSGKASPPV